MLYYNGNIYNENLSQSFHLWNGTAWVPSSDPRVVSLNGSLASAVGRLVDNNLNVWVTDGGIVYMNGSPAGYTNNVVQLLYFNNVVYQENQSSLWWFYDGSTWVARNSLGDPRVTSANGSNIPSSSVIIDSAHNVWTVIAGKIYENGVPAGYTDNVVLLEYSDGTMYSENESGTYVSWNGATWVSRAPSSIASVLPPEGVSSLGYTDQVFYDDFSDLGKIDLANSQTPNQFWWYLAYGKTTSSNPNPPLRDSSHISQATYKGTKMLRLDGKGAAIQGGVNYEKKAYGPSFTVKNGGGAYFEAKIAYSTPIASSDPTVSDAWPGFFVTSQNHMVRLPVPWGSTPDSIHYVEMDIMEYFLNNSDGKYDSHATLIDWFGGANPPYTKVQDGGGQYMGPGTPGYFTSASETSLVFHTYGALWVPSLPMAGTSPQAYTQGYVQWFLDGQPATLDGKTAAKIMFSGVPPSTMQTPVYPWTFSVMDGTPLSIVLDTGSNAFMYVNYVSVWQLP